MMRTLALFLLSVFCLTACSGGKVVRTTVDRQNDFSVALESIQKDDIAVGQNYAHPFEMEESDLEQIMEDLRYTEKRLMETDKPGPVFQAVEIDRLAPVLAATLGKADGNQRIRFLSFNQGKLWVLSVPRKTEGVIFVDAARRLNIAFNSINVKCETAEINSIYPIYSSDNPLSIKDSDATLLAAAPFSELHRFENGEPAPMWIVANLENLKMVPARETPTAVDTRVEVTPAVEPKPEPVGTPVEIEAAERAGELKVSPASEILPAVKAEGETAPAAEPEAEATGTRNEKATPDQAKGDFPDEEIRNRLKFLKELLDEGLITEKDYEGKKNELLNRIQ